MPPHRASAGPAPRPVVFLPGHELDDVSGWLEEHEADDLLAAWTAAWHPRLIAAGGMPRWASVDLPPPDGPLVGIVPPSWDGRFAAQFDATAADVRVVRGTGGRGAITAAALEAAGLPADVPAADAWVDDFQALGLAVLLSELLARRMRAADAVAATDLPAAVEAAAAAAAAGDGDATRAALAECYRRLEAARARYYPVDCWLVDLVLLAPTTSAASLRAELAAPVPLGIVAEGRGLADLAVRAADALPDLRRRIDEGGVCPCGGPLADRPLDACTPEEILESFTAGAAAWRGSLGRGPAVFARHGGGGSAVLPQVLAGLDYAGAIWGTFDGAPLPDPGAGRIAWEGTADAVVEAVARPPLDARSAAAVLALPERLGDALDHDHVAVVTFAHHAGTAGEWHDLVRRIGSATTALGTFVAPDDLCRRTAGTGTLAAFGPDAFPPTPVPADGPALDAAAAAATAAARRLVERAGELAPVLAAAPAIAPRAATRPPARGFAAWWPAPRRADPELALESDAIRVVVHPETGGILALKRPDGGPNRLSQQLALSRPEGHGRMLADEIRRGPTASGAAGIVSRGRLLDAAGGTAGTFVQGLSIVPGLPLVAVDVEVALHAATAGRLADHHVACRFAWHENADVDIRRGIHAQSVATERTRFTAPHFFEIVPAGPRGGGDAVAILSGGLPWHVRSSTHVLDTILAGAAGGATRRLAVGLGLARPWDAALEWLAGVPLGSGPRPGPEHVRVTVHDVERRDGRVVRARIGLVESTGRAGDVRVEWARDVVAASPRELDGRPRSRSTVAIDGRAVIVFLRAYEWLVVDLEFAA